MRAVKYPRASSREAQNTSYYTWNIQIERKLGKRLNCDPLKNEDIYNNWHRLRTSTDQSNFKADFIEYLLKTDAAERANMQADEVRDIFSIYGRRNRGGHARFLSMKEAGRTLELLKRAIEIIVICKER